ncbi:NAD-dependent epimerase/dehydratase family protein [Francisella sciaenopsi]|uniref:NAD(P)-dependent oxidoreductase n=1 Tax=Francisella sciaenopsi TaxID=3055034 RepID=A0ABQ6PJD8_9GAMM
MSNVLVVGGKGYVGRHLKKKFPNFIYCGRSEFDLTSKQEIIDYLKEVQIDTCIILSASIGYDQGINFYDEPFQTNLLGLNNLLSVLSKCTKIIYFSSMTVYDPNNVSPVNEEAKLKALHSYALSKIYAEQLIKYYSFKSLIIRIPGIYGGDRKAGLIYNSIQKMRDNIDVDINTDNLGYWETMHVDDMVECLSELFGKYEFKSEADILNISYGEEVDLIATLKFIKEKLGSDSLLKVSRKYTKLYLSNKKLKNYNVNIKNSYYKRLDSYIEESL